MSYHEKSEETAGPVHDRVGSPIENRRPRDFLYFQVHYQPVPGAKRGHFTAIQPKLTERLQDMIRREQLLIAGAYPASIGGVWLLRVRSRSEAERLVQDNPAVGCNLVTYRLIELQEPTGLVVHTDTVRAVEQADA